MVSIEFKVQWHVRITVRWIVYDVELLLNNL